MKTQKNGRKANHVTKVKSYLKEAVNAIAETSWVIMTGFVVGLVTPSVHARGAPLKG